jgi:iron complex transport system permease protein
VSQAAVQSRATPLRSRTRDRKIRTGPAAAYFPAVATLLGLAAIAAIAIGSTEIAWGTVIRVVAAKILPAGWIDTGGITEAEQVIIWLIRMPRVIVAALAGGALAVAGTQLQGIFRNPLAEPSVIGVSQGAALGAVIAFVTDLATRSALWLPLCSFVGAFVALFAVYLIASRAGRTPIATLLLAGIAVGALITAVSSLLISLNFVNWQVAAEIVFWMMGGLDSRTWTHVWISLPFLALGLLVSLWHVRDLDLMLLGDETAASLGVETETVKRTLLTTAALLTGAAVAVSGVIGFVGLIVPHMVRLILGPSHRTLLPASALTGALFLIVCDLIARTVHPPTEIRLGIVTAAFGAPFFLYLLRRRRKEIGYL